MNWVRLCEPAEGETPGTNRKEISNMRFLNTIFRQASQLNRGLERRHSSPASIKIRTFVQPIAAIRDRKVLRAQWILEGDKLHLAWTSDDDPEAVPLAQALPFNAIFIRVRREYKARLGMRGLVFVPDTELGPRCAA
jgi:hypothetical protein